MHRGRVQYALQIFGHIDKVIFRWPGDWRDGSAVLSSDCPSKGPRFNSPYPNEDAQPSVAQVPEALMPSSCFCGHKHTHGTQTYITCRQTPVHMKYTHTFLKAMKEAACMIIHTAVEEINCGPCMLHCGYWISLWVLLDYLGL